MNDTTAMEDDVAMSETQTMAGDEPMEQDEMATEDMAAGMENPVDYEDMFEAIDNTEQYDIVALAKTSPDLSTFVQLVEKANMANTLRSQGTYTVFVPTNEAFARLPKEQLDMLLKPENKAQLMKVLQAHVLPSEVYSTQFTTTTQIELSDERHLPVNVDMNGTRITVGGATIVQPNVEASNGVLHVVDRVIIPSGDAVEDRMGF